MKVGNYARSSEGDLGKIVRINNSHDIELEDSWVSYDEEDLKSSPNIIDLIEVGDYVNEHKVRAVYLEGITHYIKLEPRDEEGTRTYNKDIKSVVTKEQFSSMEYKVSNNER